MSDFCYICLNNTRPVKFISDRIRICQWCVTLLHGIRIIDPEGIEQHFLGIVKKNIRKPPQEPRKYEIKIKEHFHLKSIAHSHVIKQESFLESLAASFINRDKREKKVQELLDIYEKQEKEKQESLESIKRQAYEVYCEDLKKYNSEIDNEINENYKKLISGEYRKIRLDSTEKNFLKYLRAYNYNLLSGKEKSIRSNEQSIKELRSHIKKQDQHTCKLCSKSGDGIELHVHHIIPIDKFGSNHQNNLITVCHSCHNKQHPGFQVTRNIPITRKRTGGEFIAIDIETTGLSSKNDHIIELAAVKFKSAETVDVFQSLVNPGIPIPYKIIELTGINNVMASCAPTIDEVFHEFIKFIGCEKLVLHNSSFDMRFIIKYADEFGYTITNEVVDTLRLSRKKVPHLSNHKLQTLVRHFNIVTNGKHRALADSYATAQVYIECLRAKN